jgi:hypothetical protein
MSECNEVKRRISTAAFENTATVEILRLRLRMTGYGEAVICHARRHGRKDSCRGGGRGWARFIPIGAEKAAIIGHCTPERKKTRKFDKIGKLALTAS